MGDWIHISEALADVFEKMAVAYEKAEREADAKANEGAICEQQ